MNGISLKVYLEDLLGRLGYPAEIARDHTVALLKTMRSPTLKATPFAILIPFSDAPPVFSGAVNSFRVRADDGLSLVIDLMAIKRNYEEHN